MSTPIPPPDVLAGPERCATCGAIVFEYPDRGNGPFWWPVPGEDEPCFDENGLPAPHSP